MKIDFACSCGKRLQVDAGHAGKKGKCPQCGRILVIPAADPVKGQSDAAPIESTPPELRESPSNAAAKPPLPAKPAGKGSPLAKFWARHGIHYESRRPAAPGVRPWVRFWARQFDLLLFGVFFVGPAAFVAGRINPPLASFAKEAPGEFQAFLAVVATFMWAVVESELLAANGTTPGKSLFKVRIAHPNYATIPFEAALTRSLKVWFRGLALGFPLINLLTMAYARDKLERDGSTSWDKEGGFVVRHERIGAVRVEVDPIGWAPNRVE
jgi:uncharacterized RDD family membrane protein YckC